MTKNNNSIGSNASPRRLVHCGACDRTVECSAADLLRYTREGWPKCCGQVMALFTEAERPHADDTKVDRPALPEDQD